MAETRKPELFLGGPRDGCRLTVLHGNQAVFTVPGRDHGDQAEFSQHVYRATRLMWGGEPSARVWLSQDLPEGADVLAILIAGYDRRPAVITQDGGDFYDEGLGRCIWSSPVKVRDFDTDAAIAARSAFVAWCDSAGIKPIFESDGGGR